MQMNSVVCRWETNWEANVGRSSQSYPSQKLLSIIKCKSDTKLKTRFSHDPSRFNDAIINNKNKLKIP